MTNLLCTIKIFFVFTYLLQLIYTSDNGRTRQLEGGQPPPPPPPSIDYYISHNSVTRQALEDSGSFSEGLSSELVDFELNSDNCAALNARDEVFINIFLTFLPSDYDGEFGDDFDLKSIIIDLRDCDKQYNVVIGSTQVQENGDLLVNEIPAPTNNLYINLVDLEVVKIFSIIIHDSIISTRDQIMAIDIVQQLHIIGCIFKNLQSSRDYQMFHLGDIETLNMTGVQIMGNKIVDKGLFVMNDVKYITLDTVITKLNDSNEKGQNAGVFYIESFKSLNVSECQSHQNSAKLSGAFLFASDGESATINLGLFIQNSAQDKGGSFHLEYIDNLTVVGPYFAYNFGVYGGGISTVFVDNITVISPICEGNYGIIGGCLFLNDFASSVIQQGTFQGNAMFLSYGGAVALYNHENEDKECSFIIDNCQFTENGGQFGGAMQVRQIQNLTQGRIINTVFKKNTSQDGGAVQVEQVFGDLLFDNDKFIENGADGKGGGGILFLNSTDITISNSLFKGNTVKNQGSGIMITYLCDNVTIIDGEFLDNSSDINGGGIYGEYFTNSRFENLLFKGNNAFKEGGGMMFYNSQHLVIKNIIIEENQAKIAAGLKLDLCTDVRINKCYIRNNEVSQQGGGLYLFDSQEVYIDTIEITDNVALVDSGGLYIQNSVTIQITNAIINNNYGIEDGGGGSLSAARKITFENLTCHNNFSNRSGGGLKLQKCEEAKFVDFSFRNNTSDKQNGGGIQSDSNTKLEMINGDFTNNYAIQGGGISLYTTSMYNFENVLFLNNTAKNYGGGLYLSENSDGEYDLVTIQENNSGVGAGGMTILNSRSVTLRECPIENNVVSKGDGGGLFVAENSEKIKLMNSQVRNNQGLNQGGGIYISEIKSVTIDSCIFDNNSVNEKGGGIYAEFVEEEINVKNTQFINHVTSVQTDGEGEEEEQQQNNNSRNLEDQQGGEEEESNNHFENIDGEYDQSEVDDFFNISTGQIFPTEFGPGIYVSSAKKVNIISTTVKDNKGFSQGAGVFLDGAENVKIHDSLFENNILTDNGQSSFGGAVLIDGSTNVEVLQSRFLENDAFMYGGGLYLKDVENTVIEDCNFVNNHVLYDENVSLYEKNEYYMLTQGGGIFYMPVNDEAKTSEELGTISFSVINTLFDGNMGTSGGGIMINQKPGIQVVYDFENVTCENNVADIGPCMRKLAFGSSYDVFKKFSNKIIMRNNKKLVETSSDLYQGYYKNEKLRSSTDTSQFSLCVKGSFLKTGGEKVCDSCIENGVCEGGYIPLYPEEKYWRDQVDSYDLHHCYQYDKVCIGNDTCEKGHKGLFCENCDVMDNYSLSGKDCQKCADNTQIYLRIVGIFIAVVLLIANQIIGVKLRIQRRQIQKCLHIIFNYVILRVSQLSGYTKIFIMHTQILFLVGADIDFGIEVSNVVEIVGNPSQIMSKNLNCLIDVKEEEDVKKFGFQLTFYGLIAIVACLVFIIILEIILFFGKKYIQNNRQLFDYIKCSLLCFFITMQPGILQQSLQFLTCRSVSGKKYCVADTNIDCSSTFYKTQVIPVNLVISFTLGLFIPIFLGVRLYFGNKQQILSRVTNQRKYGILYMEHKHHLYFWEIITLLTKIVVVVTSILFQQENIIKGSLVSIVMMMYLIACYHFRPFITKTLNMLSILATIIQIISIIFFMCQKTLDEDDGFYMFSMIVIFVSNGIFILIAGLLMAYDFKMTMRQFAFKVKTVCGCLRRKVVLQTEKEKRAKLRWKKLKQAINETHRQQRQNTFDQSQYQNFLGQEISKQFADRSGFKHKVVGRNGTLYSQKHSLSKQDSAQSYQKYVKSGQNLPSDGPSSQRSNSKGQNFNRQETFSNNSNSNKSPQIQENKLVEMVKAQEGSQQYQQIISANSSVQNSALNTRRNVSFVEGSTVSHDQSNRHFMNDHSQFGDSQLKNQEVDISNQLTVNRENPNNISQISVSGYQHHAGDDNEEIVFDDFDFDMREPQDKSQTPIEPNQQMQQQQQGLKMNVPLKDGDDTLQQSQGQYKGGRNTKEDDSSGSYNDIQSVSQRNKNRKSLGGSKRKSNPYRRRNP